MEQEVNARVEEVAQLMEWSVYLEVACSGASEDTAEELLERLESYAPAVAIGQTGLSVQFSVAANDARAAVGRAMDEFYRAYSGPGEVVRIEVETEEDLAQALTAPDGQEFVGISELAELLGVTRQRASQIAQTRAFPQPLASLAAGPIWRRSSLRRFLQQYERRPGRPVVAGHRQT